MLSPAKGRDGYYAKARTEMLAFIPADAKKVLDVGCAEGVFSSLAAACAQKHLDTVLVGDITALMEKLPDAYFDCIVCNDVLEHLVDPYTAVSALKGKLSAMGVLVFSLPNVRHLGNLKNLLIHRDWRYEDEGILDKTHLRFFTEKSIRRLFADAGYTLVTIRGLRPVRSWKFILLNLITLGSLSDARYLQFAGVAKPA